MQTVLQSILAGQSANNQLHSTAFWVSFVLMAVWSLIWKGLALWKAAHRESKIWFVFLLVLNTMGILEIIYYFFIDKEIKKEVK
jgi:hypothetical protein